MNLQIDDAVEYMNDVEQGKIGEIFIRCNNVLFIGEKQSEQDKEMKE